MKSLITSTSPFFLNKRLEQYRALLKQELENVPEGKTKNQVPRIVKLRKRIKLVQGRLTSTLNK